jgi:hypothetical protein
MKTIPLYVESPNGHDTIEVEGNDLQEEIEEQLEDDKWVTLEKEDGSTEILTEEDIPKGKSKNTESTPPATYVKSEEEEWAEKFEKVKSATATHKAKGG